MRPVDVGFPLTCFNCDVKLLLQFTWKKYKKKTTPFCSLNWPKIEKTNYKYKKHQFFKNKYDLFIKQIQVLQLHAWRYLKRKKIKIYFNLFL